MHEKLIMGDVIEGESYVGKTTTIEALRNVEGIIEKGIIVVPEYSVVGPLPDFAQYTNSDLKKAIQQIIDLEKKRTDKLAKDLAADKSQLVIFDRGPVSCIAFQYAAERHGYKGAALWIAEAFQREIEDKNIIVPNGFIHLTADRSTIKEREAIDLASGHKRIIDFLQDQEVARTLNEAFSSFGKFLPNQLFLTLDTGNKNPQEVAAEVLQFIKNQPADVLDNIPDFVKYAQSLLDS